MKAIANTLLACCCLLLLIGCQKEQQNESGLMWTSYGRQAEIVAAYHVDGDEYIAYNGFVSDGSINSDGFINFVDDYYYYLYFNIIRDTLNQHELCCIGGEEAPVFHKGDLFLDSLLIPEKITVNIPFDNGYRTVTFTVTEIGGAAFKDCSSLTSITLTNSIQNIGYQAFEGCSSLTSITLPISIQNIGYQAFEGCSSLTSITLPNSIQNIGYQAFEGCPLETISVIQNGDKIRERAFESVFCDCPSESLSLILPEGLKHVGNDAFSDCSSLTSVIFPNSIQSIGSGAFSGCSSIASVSLPNAIQEIGSWAFSHSSITSIVLPNSIQKIGERAFSECPLETISFCQGIDTIGELAFNQAFSGCCSGSLTLILPEGLKHIGNLAFQDCSSLTSVIIPNSIQIIGLHAFSVCSSLNTCLCYAIIPPTLIHDQHYLWGYYGITDLPFAYCPLQAIYVPRESVEAYKTAEGWEHYADIIYPIE